MPWAAAISGLTNMGGAVIGAEVARADREQAARLIQQSVDDLVAQGIPTIEAQQMVMQRYKSAGKLDPKLEDAVTLGDTNLNAISLDPKYKEAQLKALDELQGISDGGGYNLSDKASLEKMMGDINADERGHREAILADARSKGQVGSGSELVAQLMNQQASADRAHSSGLSVAAEAQKRALDAILQKGNLAGSLRTQDYGEQAKAKEAQDAIARWNAENSQSVRGANVNRTNTAQQYNLSNDQRIMDNNTDITNQESAYNKSLIQKQFDNQTSLNAAKANARAGQATNYNNNANATQAAWTKAGQGVGQIATAYGQKSNTQDEEEKKKTYSME